MDSISSKAFEELDAIVTKTKGPVKSPGSARIGAMILVSELGGAWRFDHPRQLMASHKVSM
jgi:hypothetical protein